MSLSPTCTVQDGAGAPQATTNGVDVTAGNVQTIQLQNPAGVDIWTIQQVGSDEVIGAASLTIDAVNKKATFAAEAGPWSRIFKSTVQAAGSSQQYSTTFKVCVKTGGGARLAATNETTENNATSGWTGIVNYPIRNPGGGGSVPTGSGFVHITAGAQDAAASHGTAAQIPITNAGATDVAWASVSGDATLSATGAVAVVSLTGSAGTLAIAATGATVSVADGQNATIKIADAAHAGVAAFNATVQGQNNTSAAASSFGGNAVLNSGTSGVGAANAGNAEMQTGGTAQWRATPSALVNVQNNPIQFGTGTMPTTGQIRFDNANATTNRLAHRDNANTVDMVILATNPTTGVANMFDGASPGTKWGTLQIGATLIGINVNVSSGLQLWNKAGTASNPVIQFYTGTAGTIECLRILGDATTSTVRVVDTTAASATGVSLTVSAQNATGTTSTGGDLVLSPGTGTTSNGKLNLNNIITGTTVGAAGGASALPATPTGYLNIKVNGTAQRVPYYA